MSFAGDTPHHTTATALLDPSTSFYSLHLPSSWTTLSFPTQLSEASNSDTNGAKNSDWAAERGRWSKRRKEGQINPGMACRRCDLREPRTHAMAGIVCRHQLSPRGGAVHIGGKTDVTWTSGFRIRITHVETLKICLDIQSVLTELSLQWTPDSE